MKDHNAVITFDGMWIDDECIANPCILAHSEDGYGGVVVGSSLPCSQRDFDLSLAASILSWSTMKKRSIWLSLTTAQVNAGYAQVALKHGFEMHSVVSSSCLMLTMWLAEGECSLPKGATHTLGVGCVCLDNKNNKILVVREKYGPLQSLWKIPTGAVEPGEDIAGACVRELKEETGIEAAFRGVIMLRHMHNYLHDKGDIFCICLMNFDATMSDQALLAQESEIDDVQWMDLTIYLSQSFFDKSPLYQQINKTIVDVYEGKVVVLGLSALESGWSGAHCLYHPCLSPAAAPLPP